MNKIKLFIATKKFNFDIWLLRQQLNYQVKKIRRKYKL